MSRSRRKTPVTGMTKVESDKPHKVASHQQARAAARRVVPDEDALYPHPKEHGNPWAGGKDGKQYFDAAKHPGLMRK